MCRMVVTIVESAWLNQALHFLLRCLVRGSTKVVGVIVPGKLWDNKPTFGILRLVATLSLRGNGTLNLLRH